MKALKAMALNRVHQEIVNPVNTEQASRRDTIEAVHIRAADAEGMIVRNSREKKMMLLKVRFEEGKGRDQDQIHGIKVQNNRKM